MKPLRILQICPQLPFPPDTGGRIGIYEVTRHLALRGHRITLVALVREFREAPGLERYSKVMQIGPIDTRSAKCGMVANLFSTMPYTIAKYQNAKASRALVDLVRHREFDLVYLDHLHTAYYGAAIMNFRRLPIVLREHNVETRIMERLYQNAANPVLRLWAYIQYERVRSYESRMCELFDRCLMMSDVDEDLIRRINPRVRTAVVPVGVDTDYFQPQKGQEDPYLMLFVGPMDWLPNVDGISWFCKEVLPLIAARVPEAKVLIVGRNPPPRIRNLASERVIVKGYVEDVRPYMARAGVVIVPLRIGSGVRVKILHAFAMAKAVVATSVGCEGIDAKHGEHLYVADTREAFAEQVAGLMSSQEERHRLGLAARGLVESKYSWSRIAERLEEVLLGVVEEFRGSGQSRRSG